MANATRSQAKTVVKYETLANLNNNTGKHTSWLVRIKSPQVQPVAFMARGEKVQGHRFQCVLTSTNEKEYMFGVVPFDFGNRSAAQEAMRQFAEESVWEISNPAFDLKAKNEYISTPLKTVLLLKNPTKTTRLEDPGDAKGVMDAWPSGSVHVPLSLNATIKTLKKIRFQPAFGSEKEPSQALDICGKLSELGELKLFRRKDGSPIQVADLTLVDDSSGSFSVTVWGKDTYNRLKNVATGEGISLISCTAVRDQTTREFKVNIWPTVHVILGGDRAGALTQLPATVVQNFTPATAGVIPAASVPIDVNGVNAMPTCTAALSESRSTRGKKRQRRT